MKKNGSLVFIVLALGITWVLWIPALVLVSAKGYPLPTIDYLLNHRSFAIVNSEHGLAVVLFSLAVYGPLLAGLIVTLMEGGRKRAAEWFAPVLRWKFKPYWLGIVLLIALAVSLLPILVGTAHRAGNSASGWNFPAGTAHFGVVRLPTADQRFG